MSEYQTKPDTGAMFTPKEPRHDRMPRWQGYIVLSPEMIRLAQAGQQLQIAAWEKESHSGKVYLSLQISKKWEPPADGPPRRRASPEPEEQFDDGDAPF